MKKAVFVFMITVSIAMSVFGQTDETETTDLFDRKWSKENIEKLDKSVVWVPRFRVSAGLGGSFNGELTNWKLDEAVPGGAAVCQHRSVGQSFYQLGGLHHAVSVVCTPGVYCHPGVFC
jgi:hypothetical protein